MRIFVERNLFTWRMVDLFNFMTGNDIDLSLNLICKAPKYFFENFIYRFFFKKYLLYYIVLA